MSLPWTAGIRSEKKPAATLACHNLQIRASSFAGWVTLSRSVSPQWPSVTPAAGVHLDWRGVLAGVDAGGSPAEGQAWCSGK